MNKELITRDSKGVIRYIKLNVTLDNEIYTIKRSSGVLGGKEVIQPPLIIARGKAKRTVKEQMELELNSIITKYKAKGYKELTEYTSKHFSELTQKEISDLFPQEVTDEVGNIKPMLAKATDNLKPAAWERYWYISKKLDGVRCILYWDSESEEVRTISRGGKNYNASTKHIRVSPKLVHFLKNRPHIKLDGELYCHGVGLEILSGIARLKEWEPRCAVLEFHCYDLAIPDIQFQKRLELLDKLRHYFIDEKKIKVLEHTEIFGYDEAKVFHDQWVSEGYEGAILRDGTKDYGFNKRDIRMIKLKEFKDEEFEIIGYKLGLRGSEDMCFVCKTKDGVTFDPKPMGDRALKQKYVDDFENIKGKKGTVKFFYYTDEGKPFLPTFKCVRNYE